VVAAAAGGAEDQDGKHEGRQDAADQTHGETPGRRRLRAIRSRYPLTVTVPVMLWWMLQW